MKKNYVEMLIKTLNEKCEDDFIRCNAVETLGKIGNKRAVEPLMCAINDKNENIRWRVAEALGNIGDKKVVELLIVTLNNDDEKDFVRWKAAEALGNIGDKRASESLMNAIDDQNKWVHEIGMAGALNLLDIELEGVHHRAADDAWNIASILSEILLQRKSDNL